MSTEFTEPDGELTVDEDGVVRLPDGSGFFVASLPLPKKHWIYAEGREEPPMPMQVGNGPEREALAKQIRHAARWAIRASTMRGKEMDFDPDAMVQNLIIGLLGYWTHDGSHGGRLPADAARRRNP